MIERGRDELEALCRRYGVVELALFGSALTGRFDKESDLDFLVTFRPAPPHERAEAYFGLRFGLEDLFNRKVDLVVRDALQNPYLEREVTRTARALYAA